MSPYYNIFFMILGTYLINSSVDVDEVANSLGLLSICIFLLSKDNAISITFLSSVDTIILSISFTFKSWDIFIKVKPF